MLLHPEVAYRDCKDCLLYEYEHKTGEKMKGRGGLPVLRTIASHVPCKTPVIGCAKGSPTDGKELSPKNRRAYQHYKRCVAVGRFPDDSIVAQHAEIIRNIEDAIAQVRSDSTRSHLSILNRMFGGRSG